MIQAPCLCPGPGVAVAHHHLSKPADEDQPVFISRFLSLSNEININNKGHNNKEQNK